MRLSAWGNWSGGGLSLAGAAALVIWPEYLWIAYSLLFIGIGTVVISTGRLVASWLNPRPDGGIPSAIPALPLLSVQPAAAELNALARGLLQFPVTGRAELASKRCSGSDAMCAKYLRKIPSERVKCPKLLHFVHAGLSPEQITKLQVAQGALRELDQFIDRVEAQMDEFKGVPRRGACGFDHRIRNLATALADLIEVTNVAR